MVGGFFLAVVTYIPVYQTMLTNKDNLPLLTILVIYMVILVTMVYGPIAAFLIEYFPARIRYSSMSLPYHIGNGVFGGLVPGASLAAAYPVATLPIFGSVGPFVGLLYPMGIAAVGVVVGLFFIPNTTSQTRIWGEVGSHRRKPPLVPDQP